MNKRPIYYLKNILPLIIFWLSYYLANYDSNILCAIIIFSGFLFLPGQALSRIFKFEYCFTNIIALGFIWNLLVCLIAIISGININELLLLNLVGLSLILLISIFAEDNKNTKAKLSLTLIWLYLLPLALVLVLIFYFIFARGPIFEQEAFFHLSLIQKASAGSSLEAKNLQYIAGHGLHSVYGLPIWHVFLAQIAKALKMDIFSLWRFLPIILFPISLVVNFNLFQRIFQRTDWALSAVVIYFASLAAFSEGLIFSRIAVPNTLSLLIFFPLILTFVIKFIFSQKTFVRPLITTFLLLFLLALIHILQPIYLTVLLLMLTLIMVVLRFLNSTWRPELQKLLIIDLIIILAGIIILGIKSFGGNGFAVFLMEKPAVNYGSHDVFNHLNLYSKISFILFPFLLFNLKNKRLTLIIAVFLILPLLYSPFSNTIRLFFLNYFGEIFLYRLDAYFNWDFTIWSMITILIGYQISDKIKFSFNPFYRVLMFLVVFMIIFTLAQTTNIFIYINGLLNSNFWSNFLNKNYYFLLVLVSSLFILFKVWTQKVSPTQRLEIKKSNLITPLIVLILVLTLTANNWQALKYGKYINWLKLFQLAPLSEIDLKLIGGPDALNFIQTNIPAKSTILANGYANDILPLLTDNFAAAYPRSAKDILSQEIYGSVMESQKIEIIGKLNIDYIFFSPDIKDSAQYFINNKDFCLIYDHEAKIIKVLKD